MIELVDSHAHIQEPDFAQDLDGVLGRAQDAGVAAVVVPGVDLETSQAALELSRRSELVFPAAGFHPHEASRCDEGALMQLESLFAEGLFVAVGEIGLDYYRMHSPRESQLAAFEAQLAIAQRTSLPVIVHCRDAWPDMQSVLGAWAPAAAPAYRGRPLGVLHYFSSDLATAQRFHELGFLISLHTSLTHPRSQQLRDAARELPLETLLLETDSPYGAPQAYRGRRNEPSYVVEAAKLLAELHDTQIGRVAEATTANARRLFGLRRGAEVARAGRAAS